jgi:hypothetical protein
VSDISGKDLTNKGLNFRHRPADFIFWAPPRSTQLETKPLSFEGKVAGALICSHFTED